MTSGNNSEYLKTGAAGPGSDLTWESEDLYWRDNFGARPYVLGEDYERYRPAYRYGFESGRHHMGRTWEEAESDLRSGWDRYEHRGSGQSTWEDIKDAVRDAWDRVTGHSRSASEESRRSS
ncbi:MAG TPA: hypothetical protein VFK09_08795 [Gemmatimonadales bacterium]|nr:hypothetical protein [Gemmatimonadales bacterium]